MKKILKSILALTMVLALSAGSTFAATPKTKVPTLADISGFIVVEGRYSNVYAELNAKTKTFTQYVQSDDNGVEFDKDVYKYTFKIPKANSKAKLLSFELADAKNKTVQYFVTAEYDKKGKLSFGLHDAMEDYSITGPVKVFKSKQAMLDAAKKTTQWKKFAVMIAENNKVFAEFIKKSNSKATLEVVGNSTYGIPDKGFDAKSNPVLVDNHLIAIAKSTDTTYDVTYFYDKDGGIEGVRLQGAAAIVEEINGNTVIKFTGKCTAVENSDTVVSDNAELTFTFKNAGTIIKAEFSESPYKEKIEKLTSPYTAVGFM